VVHQALINDELDMYLEYTGTALTAILGEDVSEAGDGGTPVAQTTYDIVADAYREQFDLVWFDPLGLNNTYTITVRQETADELGIDSISDLEGHAKDMTLGSDQEFPVRPDGLPGLEDTYGIEFGDVKILDAGLMYSAVDKGQVDAITGYATDGRIPALGLVILEDDKDFFPPYYVAPVIRGDVLEENPELEELLNQLAGKIDDETMAELNRQVDEDGEEATDVARAFLVEQGILDG
jgi:glycine betaine/choline ABC-type transport system substrate-binding protein